LDRLSKLKSNERPFGYILFRCCNRNKPSPIFHCGYSNNGSFGLFSQVVTVGIAVICASIVAYTTIIFWKVGEVQRALNQKVSSKLSEAVNFASRFIIII
jgi:hypothetical protein